MSLMPPRTTLFGWSQTQVAAGALCALGVPSDRGNAIARGAAGAPATIRQASLEWPSPAVHGCDLGDFTVPPATDAACFLSQLETTVAQIANSGAAPLLLGGDHSLTYAPVSALSRSRELCLVWFDAHTDFSPWSGTDAPSHGAHDHKQVLRRICDLPNVRRVVQIGYRGFTIGDERQLGDNATVVTAAQARAMDTSALLQLLPEHLPCYVSLDIDAIDPLCAPGTAAPVADGLLPDIVGAMLRSIVRHRRVIGADVVEVNPVLDAHAQTSQIAAGLIHEIASQWSYQHAFGNDTWMPSRPEPLAATALAMP